MKIYVIGDSISLHYGPYLRAYLDGVMEYERKEGDEEALLNLDNPQGANGGDSGMVLSFLAAKARGGGIDADRLLLNCGLHDIKTDPATGRQQVPLPQYEENLRAILNTVAGLRPKPIWIRTTPCDEAVHNRPHMNFHRFSADCRVYNQAADEIMKDAGVPVIDLHTFTLKLGSDLYCDHVHFQDAIRKQQAAFIAGWLIAFAQYPGGRAGSLQE
jgi:lysophospholipase L1-like esterase